MFIFSYIYISKESMKISKFLNFFLIKSFKEIHACDIYKKIVYIFIWIQVKDLILYLYYYFHLQLHKLKVLVVNKMKLSFLKKENGMF